MLGQMIIHSMEENRAGGREGQAQGGACEKVTRASVLEGRDAVEAQNVSKKPVRQQEVASVNVPSQAPPAGQGIAGMITPWALERA